MRYRYLIDRVYRKQPMFILEVGTWKGIRALEMLQVSPESEYHGFDLFEDMTPEMIKAENSKTSNDSLATVAAKLKGYNFHLHKGNTRQTLAEFSTMVDFVWIDGGHSIDTIRSDWNNVKRLLLPDAEVWFDDYYTSDEQGRGPDISKFGCNLIVRDLPHSVHPHKDPVAGGGWTQMVRVSP